MMATLCSHFILAAPDTPQTNHPTPTPVTSIAATFRGQFAFLPHHLSLRIINSTGDKERTLDGSASLSNSHFLPYSPLPPNSAPHAHTPSTHCASDCSLGGRASCPLTKKLVVQVVLSPRLCPWAGHITLH